MTIEMALRPDIGQTLQMTRQAIQAIEILQYGQEELAAYVAREVERNPLVSLRPPRPADKPRQTVRHAGSRFPAQVPTDLRSIEETVAGRPSLADHLHAQLSLMRLSPHLRRLAGQIIGSLDGDGYFRRDLKEMAELGEESEADLAAALNVVRSLEPAGVGATGLADCFRLQLEDEKALTPPLAALLNHLDLLSSGDLKRLARLCGVRVEDIGALVQQLRRLTPAPGTGFDWTPMQTALPDILVTVCADGAIRVELNPEILPRVLIDRTYGARLSASPLDTASKRYLSECLQNATLLARNLDQRARTMLKIAMAIVEHQRDFFLRGASHLRPLSQKAIAKSVGVHESTVCRAIANKHILCSQGLLPLRFFFPEGIGNAMGEDGSSLANETVRRRIRTLVGQEQAGDVLSDDAIVAKLNAQGIDIARRTVAKYRTQMKIPSSAQRKRQLLIRRPA